MHKNVRTLALAMGLVMAVAAFAFAGPAGRYFDRSGPLQGLSLEKQQAVNEIVDRYNDKLEPVRRELYAKTLELEALSGNTRAEPAAIRQLAAEVAELRGQVVDNRRDMAEAIEKETGLSFGSRGLGPCGAGGCGGPGPRAGFGGGCQGGPCGGGYGW
jgi:hypothetical protein